MPPRPLNRIANGCLLAPYPSQRAGRGIGAYVSGAEITRKEAIGMKKTYQKPRITALGLLRSVTKMAMSDDTPTCGCGM